MPITEGLGSDSGLGSHPDSGSALGHQAMDSASGSGFHSGSGSTPDSDSSSGSPRDSPPDSAVETESGLLPSYPSACFLKFEPS